MPWKQSDMMWERTRFIVRLHQGERMTDLCREFEVSRKAGRELAEPSNLLVLALAGHPALPLVENMGRIESKTEANALARSLLDDVERRESPVVPYEIREARKVFQSRVAPALHDLFELRLRGYGWDWAADPTVEDDDPVTAQDLNAAGIPRKHKRLAAIASRIAIAAFACGVLCLVGSMFYDLFGRTTVVSIPLRGAGASGSAPVSLTAGTEIYVFILANTCSWSGGNVMVVDVDVRRGEQTVAHTSCNGFSRGGSGSAGGMRGHPSACDFVVPAGGADAVQVSTHLTRPSSEVTFEGLEIVLMR
jgi:hypothetical protein